MKIVSSPIHYDSDSAVESERNLDEVKNEKKVIGSRMNKKVKMF